MRTLAAVLLLLAVFGASTQCVADCLTETRQTQQTVPPCHRHSAPEPCKHSQLVANTQTPADQPVVLVTDLLQTVDPAETYLKPPMPTVVLQLPHDRSLAVLKL